jgi:mRNA interferase HigB
LKEFWESRKSDSGLAERSLSAWYKLAKKAKWANFGALKQGSGSADQVGNCVVFDVANNHYRLIVRVNYAKGIIYVLRVMDHAEYDRKLWVGTCGCHKPPPKGRPAAKKVPRSGAPTSRGREGRE